MCRARTPASAAAAWAASAASAAASARKPSGPGRTGWGCARSSPIRPPVASGAGRSRAPRPASRRSAAAARGRARRPRRSPWPAPAPRRAPRRRGLASETRSVAVRAPGGRRRPCDGRRRALRRSRRPARRRRRGGRVRRPAPGGGAWAAARPGAPTSASARFLAQHRGRRALAAATTTAGLCPPAVGIASVYWVAAEFSGGTTIRPRRSRAAPPPRSRSRRRAALLKLGDCIRCVGCLFAPRPSDGH